MTRIAAAVMTAFAIALHASAAEDCGRRIAASGPSARTIVLAGGDAWTLFRQFLAEIEQRDLDISLRKSKVQISLNGHIETIELGWALTGPSAEKQWERSLRGKRADLSPLLLAAANTAGWDVVCAGRIGSGPPVKQHETKPPSSPEAVVFFKSGVQYASRGDYANALKEFKIAEKTAPNFEGLSMNLGATYLQLKDYVKAAEYLRRAIDQNPRNAAAHYNMACLQARLGQSDDAMASLNAAKSNGMTMTASARRDPDLASLRGRSDFETLFK